MSKKTSKIQMDARKFLRAINTSAQGRIAFFNEAVRKLGEEDGSLYRLTALGTANLIYDDVHTHQYYVAHIGRLGKSNRFKIHNVREIEITESEKPKLFGKNCLDLVEAICEDNHKEAQKVWNLLHRQRFRGCVIPESGMVTSKDGIAHHITTKTADKLDTSGLADAIATNLTDRVDLHEGQIYCGVFNESGDDVVLPVTELTIKKTIARDLKRVAMEAVQSESFQRLVKSIAGRVAKKQLPESVEIAAKFLNEQQEFSSLTYPEFKTLVEDTLATQLVLNPFIAEDTAKLMYQTNIRVNRQSILEAWRNAALQTSSSEFLYNVEILSESKDFGTAYSQFLENLLNEDENHYAPEENRRWAYVNFLKHTAEQLDANKTKEPGKDTSDREALVDRVLDLSRELENEDSGHDVLLRADQMFAELREKLGDVIDTLYDYDTDPDDEEGMDELSPEGDMMQLPEVGSPGGGGAGGLGLGGDLDLGGGLGGEDDLGLGGEDDLGLGGGEDLGLGGEAGDAGGELDLAAGLPESKDRGYVPVEKMDVNELTKEYETWYTDGQIWLESEGFDECFTEMQRLIRRCTEIGEPATHLREGFEQMRDVMVAEGNDILRESKDEYSSTVSAFDLDDLDIDFNSYRPSLGEDLSGKGTRMDDLQGEGGVQTEKPKSADGRKGHKSAGSGGPEGEPGVDASDQGEQGIDPSSSGKLSDKGKRMDDLQGEGGVQTGKPKPDGMKSGGHKAMSEGEMPFCPECNKKKESCECDGGGDGEDDKKDIQDDQYRDATDGYDDAGPDAGECKRFGAVKEGKCRCADHCQCDGSCKCDDDCQCPVNEDAMVAISTDEPLSGMGDLIDKMIDKMREGGDLPDEEGLDFDDEAEMGMPDEDEFTVIDDEHTDEGMEVEEEPDADEDTGDDDDEDEDPHAAALARKGDDDDEDFQERIERELDSVEEAKHEGVMGKDTGTSMSKDHQKGKGVAEKGGKLKDKGHGMDEFQDGKGVADGKGSLKDKGSRMDDLQGSGGVQKKGVTSENKNRKSQKSRKRGKKRRR